MAPQYIFTMTDLRKTAGGKEILKGIYLSFYPGAKIGLIGDNGSGKSTLLRIMAGVDTEFSGVAKPDSKATVGYLAQEPQLDDSLSVEGNVELGLVHIRDLLNEFNAISERFAEEMSDDEMNALLEKQGNLQDKIDACNGWEFERMIEVAMDALRLPPGDAQVSTLSGGEKRRVALCQVLLSKPDILLLDEPTNHLDAESVAWLEQHLEQYEGTVVMITHDRYFLDNVAQWILELDRGSGIPWQGNYSSWLQQKQERLATEEKSESARRRQLKREFEWIQKSQKAKQSKGKARQKRYDDLVGQEKSKYADSGEIYIPPGPELAGLVLDVKGVSKAFGDRLLFEDLSFRLGRASVLGVVGPNGAGKTTLCKMISGEERPSGGDFILGDSVKLAYIDQSRDALQGDKSVWEEISDGADHVDLGGRTMASRAYVSNFAFKGQDQQKKVKVLSGGERNRVHLAKLLKSGANVIMFDEPTNDLDVGTLRSLEEGIQGFAGAAIIVSHDRWFLDRVCTHILAFEGDSQTVFYEGNYADYEADKRKRLGDDAVNPRRIKYRPLART